MLKKFALTIAGVCSLTFTVFSQLKNQTAILARTGKEHRAKEEKNFQKALALAKQKGWATSFKTGNGNIAFLMGVDESGYPIYYTTQSNVVSAATTGASQLWTGGSSGLNLSGSSSNMKDKMAIWDGGRVSTTHVELVGRVVQRDNPGSSANDPDHSTHVAGTMMASGVNPLAKGMAYGLPELVAYGFDFDASEMSAEASNLLLSNHSYGGIAGWSYNGTENRWEFYGQPNTNEDYKFGYYNSTAQLYDSIAYNAPYYLIVKSAGNSRDENGPAVGSPYYRYNASNEMTSAGNRPDGISNNDGYDIIPTTATAKNILTIGAVNGLSNGYNKPEEVTMSSFSSWGPTDDGRIKPDIVANGVGVLSPIAATDNSYATYSGTSMASPNATGSLLLLQEYYSKLHGGSFMRAATLKALAIHTADESGTAPGPDYQFGWGLLDVAKAADVIKSNNAGSHFIYENVLNNGASYTTSVVASGQGPLVATIVWTDPKGSIEPIASALDNSTRKLVNDLDIRIVKGSTTYKPWILDPAIPSAAATTGDNNLDNVERINITDIIPGETYTIQITHKGSLARGSQAYSLVISGAGGQVYCTSAPLSNSGARIDSVSFGNIHKLNAAGCTTYTNYTSTIATVEANQTLPITIKVGSCDASVTDKIVKVYIDYNSNGLFTDAGELAATSSVINGSGNFTANITTPSGLVIGNSAIMRVVVQQTSNASDVNPCGGFANGEVQDYKIVFAAPSNDFSIDLVSPEIGSCSNASQFVTVRIKNNGSVSKSNIPVSVVIKNGAATVATLNHVYSGVIAGNSSVAYTFQTPFSSTAGTTYAFNAVVSADNDQNKKNDTLNTNVVVTAATAPVAAASICGPQAILKVTNPSAGSSYFWYSSPTATVPLTSGSSTVSATITPNQTYYVSKEAKAIVGPANKTVFADGGYNTFNGNYILFRADAPVILETVKLYTGHPGKIKLVVNPMGSSTTYYPSLGDSVTLDVAATAPTPPVRGAQNNDPNDAGATYRLNLHLDNSVSQDYIMFVYCLDSASLFRNNNITSNPYPVGVPGLLTVVNNSAGTATNPNGYQNYYYFLYNMEVKTNDCVSERTAVSATVTTAPTISQVADSLVSSANSNNQWYLNGSLIAGATDKKYKPTQSGSYAVAITGSLGCFLSSASINVVLTAVTTIPSSEIELSASPNPNRGSFTVKFKVDKRDDLRIELLNMQGQSVWLKMYPKFAGTYTEQLNATVAAGIYLLKVQHGNKGYYKKIVIE